jgi:hypothetical protein
MREVSEMKRWSRATGLCVAVLMGATVLAVGVAASASGTAPYCGIRWGSLAKQASVTNPASTGPSSLVNVRAGQHPCFDRLVLDVAKGASARVRYVTNVLSQGKGDVVPLRGGARLEVVALVPDYNINTGKPTYQPANRSELVNVTGFQTFRQIAYGGSFEGSTTIGLGVRARLPFRVFGLTGPGDRSRIVVDVAHRWS